MNILSSLSYSCGITLLLIAGFLCHFTKPSQNLENVKVFAAASNDLALSIYKNLTYANNKNVFFSPIGILKAFGILYKGIRGDAAMEMQRVLGFTNFTTSDNFTRSILQYVVSKRVNMSLADSLTSANILVIEQSLGVLPEYKRYIEQQFGALVVEKSENDDKNDVVRTVNSWVTLRTSGKVHRYMQDLDPDLVLGIFDVYCFSGQWEKSFSPDETGLHVFYNEGEASSARKVPMMFLSASFPTAATDTYKVLELPYRTDDLSMVILMPNELAGLPDLERDFHIGEIGQIRQRLKRTKLELSLPKFKVDFSFDVKKILEGLGLQMVFHRGSADFGGMVVSQQPSEVTSLEHRALLEVHEGGTTTTGPPLVSLSKAMATRPVVFKVDRPFIFAIVDKKSGWIMFVGRVMKL